MSAADLAKRIASIHQPVDEEAEFWADVDNHEHDRRYPECPGGMACEGHFATIQVCGECGYEHDGEFPRFRPWPCPTIEALRDYGARPDDLFAAVPKWWPENVNVKGGRL